MYANAGTKIHFTFYTLQPSHYHNWTCHVIVLITTQHKEDHLMGFQFDVFLGAPVKSQLLSVKLFDSKLCFPTEFFSLERLAKH